LGLVEVRLELRLFSICFLSKSHYEVITFPLSQRENGWKTLGDDSAMGLDLIEAVKPGDCVILVTGDGDFISLG